MNKDIGLFIICLLIGGLIPTLLFGVDYYVHEVQEIQLYDTYYVFSPFNFAFVTVGLTAFLNFFIRGILTKFKNQLTWIFFGFGAVIMGFVAVGLYRLINSI